jgi:hypothetical protein
VSRVRSLTELCGLRITVESYVAPKGPLQCKHCQRFGHTQRNCGYAPRCVECGGSQLSSECPAPREQPQCCSCGPDHKANYRGCMKRKEPKAALAKRAPVQGQRSTATGKSAAPKARRTELSAEQRDLGDGWSHVVRGGRLVSAATPSTSPKPNPQRVTNGSKKPNVTATVKPVKPKKLAPKTASAPKRAPVKSNTPTAASTKPAGAQPTPKKLVAHPQPTNSPLEGISDLLDNLPLQACVKLNRRLLTSISSLPP